MGRGALVQSKGGGVGGGFCVLHGGGFGQGGLLPSPGRPGGGGLCPTLRGYKIGLPIFVDKEKCPCIEMKRKQILHGITNLQFPNKSPFGKKPITQKAHQEKSSHQEKSPSAEVMGWKNAINLLKNCYSTHTELLMIKIIQKKTKIVNDFKCF